ncbi:pentapeptide repeat-containing protein [Mycobacterium intracellulare]|uniref:pentapeptide repeat-containing protein n=1 Tax=Mycobacterium intracellulare TaxID=1767 RepID=UPI00109E5FB3|nr:pentapeptide repeat-containing protein [Mycobacterium intracellulare]
MTVTAAAVAGKPSVDVLAGGRDLRIWPTGRYGSLITMSVEDWRALSNIVNTEIPRSRDNTMNEPTIQIADHSGATLFVSTKRRLRAAVEEATEKGVGLSGADLSGANLSGADLSRADLSGANLYGADLSRADLSGANLSRADLSRADLSRAGLYEADLSGADLSRADLSRANLYEANLYEADLSRANLYEADLSRANLYEAQNASLAAAQTLITPSGAITAWKKCKSDVIVELHIPEKAKRSNASGRKCRAEYAEVVAIHGAEEAISQHDPDFIYRVGETVRPTAPFDEDRWNECAPGIHFYLTREEAEAH